MLRLPVNPRSSDSLSFFENILKQIWSWVEVESMSCSRTESTYQDKTLASNKAMLGGLKLKPQKHKGHMQGHCVPMQTKGGKTMGLRGLRG